MENLRVKIKRLSENAVVPQYAHQTDAGMDLVATSIDRDEYGNLIYHTGLAFEIPEGYVGLLFPRSSNCKKNLWLTNSVGVIDSGYRGEVTFKYRPSVLNYDDGTVNYFIHDRIYEVGDRIGQLIIMPYPKVEYVEVSELSDSDRGTGGYGSTGK